MKVRWTTPATRDLTNLCDYIQEHDGPAAARRIAIAIHDAIDTLQQFPARGRPGRVIDTRELVVTRLPVIVIYRLRASVVEVVRILHGAQQWP